MNVKLMMLKTMTAVTSPVVAQSAIRSVLVPSSGVAFAVEPRMASVAVIMVLVLRTSYCTDKISYDFHIVKRFGRGAAPAAVDRRDQAVAAGAEHPAVPAQPSGLRTRRPQRRRPRLPRPGRAPRSTQSERPGRTRRAAPRHHHRNPGPARTRRLGSARTRPVRPPRCRRPRPTRPEPGADAPLLGDELLDERDLRRIWRRRARSAGRLSPPHRRRRTKRDRQASRRLGRPEQLAESRSPEIEAEPDQEPEDDVEVDGFPDAQVSDDGAAYVSGEEDCSRYRRLWNEIDHDAKQLDDAQRPDQVLGQSQVAHPLDHLGVHDELHHRAEDKGKSDEDRHCASGPNRLPVAFVHLASTCAPRHWDGRQGNYHECALIAPALRRGGLM